MVLKLGQFGKWIRNNWEVFKCGAGEISCTDRVGNEVLKGVKKERKILQTKRRKANWIGKVLRINWLLKRVTEGNIEGRIEVTG